MKVCTRMRITGIAHEKSIFNLQKIFSIFSLFLLASCGGSSNDPAIDETPPDFTSNATLSVPENTIDVISITTNDSDASLVLSGTDSTLFALQTNGSLSFIAAPDFEKPADTDTNNVYELIITATDATGNTAQQELTVTVTDVDEIPPAFTSNPEISVSENTTAVVTVTTDDATALLVLSGVDAAIFTLASGGVLSFTAAPDFEAPADADINNIYLVTVTATDTAGNHAQQDLIITVTDIDETTPSNSSVLKTGQVDSYDAVGTLIEDGSLQDDGFYQAGTVRNFTRDDTSGFVTDNVSGLIWNNSGSVLKQWLTTANFDAANYSDTSGDTATTYCADMADGGFNDWRLPTIKELSSIAYYDTQATTNHPTVDPAIGVSTFTFHWSSTTVTRLPSAAFYYDFKGSRTNWQGKNNSYLVMCVRDSL